MLELQLLLVKIELIKFCLNSKSIVLNKFQQTMLKEFKDSVNKDDPEVLQPLNLSTSP